MTNNALDRLNTLGAEVKRMQEEMREAAQEAVKDGTQAIFAEYGDLIEQFGWTQYTPYFNDGEPCEFSMGELSIIAKVDMEELEARSGPFDDDWSRRSAIRDNEWHYGGSSAFGGYGEGTNRSDKIIGHSWNNSEKPNPDFDERYSAAKDAIQTVYNILSQNDKLARDIFDDHVEVIFTSEGVDVEEYDHD